METITELEYLSENSILSNGQMIGPIGRVGNHTRNTAVSGNQSRSIGETADESSLRSKAGSGEEEEIFVVDSHQFGGKCV